MSKMPVPVLIFIGVTMIAFAGNWNQSQASSTYQSFDDKAALIESTDLQTRTATANTITRPASSTYSTSDGTPSLAIREQTLNNRQSSQATYIKVNKSCDAGYQGACLNVRRRPSTNSSVTEKLRKDIILKVSDTTHNNGRLWYQVEFTDWLRYPSRVGSQWWIAGDYVEPIQARGFETDRSHTINSDKQIIVDVSDQTLYAYEGDSLFMQQSVSTGLPSYPTPRGTFPVYKMTPSRYMQGPIPGITDDSFDLPGVPWNLYFTQQGAVIHGTYWHNNFGQKWSHGCVNIPPTKARKLYKWANLGTKVVVKN